MYLKISKYSKRVHKQLMCIRKKSKSYLFLFLNYKKFKKLLHYKVYNIDTTIEYFNTLKIPFIKKI